MKNIDNYLNHIQTGEPIEEDLAIVGLVGGMFALWGLMVWAAIDDARKYPKHPKWKKIWADHERMHSLCAKHFPDESTTMKAGGAFGAAGEADFSYKSYKANPQRIKCQMTARINTLKKFITWVSKVKSDEICKYNTKKPEKCAAYVEQIKKARIDELRDLTRTLKMSSPQRLLTKIQYKKLHNVLGVKKLKR